MRGSLATKALLVAAATATIAGGWLMIDQQRALSRVRPVSGQLVNAGVVVTPWGTHRPRVTVSYVADGTERQTRRWSWLSVGGTAQWARAAAADMSAADASPKGVKVWVDPSRAGAAWLDVTPTAIPLAVWLAGVVMLGGWVSVWRAERARLASSVATPTGHHGWYGLRGLLSGASCVTTAWVRAALVLLCGLPAIGLHYGWVGGPASLVGLAAIAVWSLVTLAWIVRAMRLGAWSGRVVPPTVLVTRAVMCLEHDVVARVTLRVRRPVVLRSVRTSLVCRRSDGMSTTELFRTSVEDARQTLARPDQPIAGTHGFAVPPRKRRATLNGDSERIAWSIEVAVQPEYGPPITTTFPVDAAHDAAPAAAKPRLVGVTKAA